MNRGIEVTGSQPRELTLDGEHVISGGNGTDGIRCVGKELMLDGKVIAESAKTPKVGPYIKNGNIVYGTDVVKEYPQGLTTVFSFSPNAWYMNYPTGWVLGSGARQGAAIFGGKWYQFFAGGHCVVVDIELARTVDEFDIPYELWPHADAYHISSAQFSDEYATTNDELPLVYLTTNGYTCVMNLNGTPSLVRWWYIDHNVNHDMASPAHAAIGAFDFKSGIGYSIGYPQGVGTGVANHVAGGKFEIIPYTFPTSGSGDCNSAVVLDVAHKVILDKTQNVTYVNEMEEGVDRDWSNCQDADFHDGHIYILYGGANGGNDRPKIIDYIPMSASANAMYTNITRTGDGTQGAEGEGMCHYKNGWIVSGLYTIEKIFVL